MKMKFWIYSILLIAVQFSVANLQAVSAQENLSLEDAIKLSLSQNYDIQLTKKNIELNELQNTWGQAGRYPTIGINAKQGNSISDQSNNPLSFVQALLKQNTIEGGANLNWVLFNGFRVKANKEKLENLVAKSEGSASLVVENSIQGVILNYYAAKLQSEKLVLLRNVLDLSREKWEYQQLKQDLGTVLRFDVLQYESSFLADSTNLLMQQLALKNSIRNLNLLMGVSETMTWNLTDDINIETAQYDFESLKSKMLSNNQNIKNEYVNLEILSKDISLAKTTMYPVLSFNTGMTGNYSNNRIGDQSMAGSTLNYYANFTLSFTLYDGGKVKRGIKALGIQNEITEIQITQLKSRLSTELLAQYDLYNSRVQILELAKKSFDVAGQNFEIIKLKEQTGLINSFTFRDIEMAYLSSGIKMIEANYNLIESQTNISRLTGGLVDDNSEN